MLQYETCYLFIIYCLKINDDDLAKDFLLKM